MIAQIDRKAAVIIILVCLLQWALLLWDRNPTWDAAFYYANARSIVFDNDLQIDNDLLLSYPTASEDFVLRRFDKIQTATGRVDTPFAIGSSLLWVPWLATLRVTASLGQALTFLPRQLSGYEWHFTLGIATFSALLGWFAFWPGYLLARSETSRFSSLAAVLTLLFTTPLIYYQTREPLFAHATSALINSLVVYVWWRSYSSTPAYRQGILLGALIGLTGLVRSQQLVFFALPVISTIWWWVVLPSKERRDSWTRVLGYLAIVLAAITIVFSIQMAHWFSLFGDWITIPYGPLFMDWRAPLLVPLLLSTFRGILPWMPVFLFSVLGLFLLGRRKPRLAVPLIIVLILVIYVNSSTRDWFGGGGYGPRRFSEQVIIFVLGYASLVKTIPDRYRKPFVAITGLILILHQWILLRYGIEEEIGGRVVAMYPSFEWVDQSYAEFGRQLLSYLGYLFRTPADFLILNLSPLARVMSGSWPLPQISSLVATILFLIVSIYLGRSLYGRIKGSKIWFWVALVSGLLVIAATDIWVLFRA